MTKHAEIDARLAAAIAQPRMLVDHATVPTELLADALAEITRLKAELIQMGELHDQDTADFNEQEAEVATLREAAQRLIDNAGGLAVTNTSARQLVQIEDVRDLASALSPDEAAGDEQAELDELFRVHGEGFGNGGPVVRPDEAAGDE